MPSVRSANGTVAVKAPDGSLWNVPAGQMTELPEGASIASHDEVQQAQDESKYGGAGGAAIAAAIGAGRGLSFGATDAAAIEGARAFGKGDQVREALRGYESANPVASALGEFGSLLIPGIGEVEALGKGAQAAKYAGGLQRGVFGAGRAAEVLAGRVVGREAESLLGRTAQRAVREGAGAAVEGAAFGAGHELSDAYINDHDLTAEKLWAGAGKGALLGAGLGAGVGAAGELGSSALGGLGSYALKKLNSETMAEMLEKQSAEAAFRAVGAPKPVTRAVNRFSDEGMVGAGRIYRDEIPGLVGKDSIGAVTREDLPMAVEKGLAREGKRIGDIVDKLDAKAAELPLANDLVGDIDHIIKDLEGHGGTSAAIRKLEEFKGDVVRITKLGDGAAPVPLSFSALKKLSGDTRTLAYGAKINPDLSGFKGSFAELRDKFETRLTDAMDKASATVGSDLKKEYIDAKKKYQAFKWLEKAADENSAKSGSNLFVNLTEKIASSAGGVIGAILGGPVGMAIGTGVGYAGSHLARKHGAFFASEAMQKLGTLAAAERISGQVDHKIADGVSGFLRGARAETTLASKHRESPQVSMDKARHVASIASNPDAMMNHIESRIGNLGPMAPNLTRALSMKAANDYQFLASKVPQQHKNFASLTPQFEKTRFSDEQARIFGKYLKGVEDPISILHDLRNGTLGREKVEAVKATSPKLYEQIRNQVIEETSKLGNKLPYAKRLQLGILFQAPTDETLTPEFIQEMQQTTVTPSGMGSPPPSKTEPRGGGRRPIDLDSQALSPDGDRIEAGRD